MSSPSSASPPPRIVTARAVFLGLALIPLNAYWVILSELRWYCILTLNPLFVTPVFFLLMLVALNGLLRAWRPRWAFRLGELLTVYIMLAISCTVATHDFAINLVSTLGWAAWFATPENRWESIIYPYLPRWALVWDRAALRGFFEGGTTLYRGPVLLAWAKPLGIWIAFMLVLFGVLFCLNVMVRRAWIEETKLSFPAVRLPLAMAGLESPGFWTNRLLWIGVALPIISGTLNGLAVLYPTIPHFTTRARWPHFVNPPWYYLNGAPTSYYPFAIGLGYFVPLDVLFSCWFFYLFVKAQYIVGYYLGVTRLPDYPWVMEQGIGAWTTYGILILYVTRHHWQRLFSALRTGADLDDAQELLSYRHALYGVLIGLAVLVAFWRAIGMTLLPALIAVGLYFLLALCITRVRAEAGSQHTVWDLEPINVFGLVDTHTLGKGNIIGAGLSHWFWRLNRSHAMPTQLEGLKLWHDAGLIPRQLALPMLAATALSVLAAPWACLHVAYREGAAAKCIGFSWWTGYEIYNWWQQMLTVGRPLQWARLATVGASAGLILLLWFLQARYTWLWFHPLGYCAGPGMIWVWFPFLIAWAVKLVVIRYGGQTAYRRLMPFFLGLVLGDYFTGSVWSILSQALNFQGYQIFH